MSMTDPVADMLTRIRNASKAKHEKVDIPSSTLKAEVARILKEEGYIKNVKMVADAKQGIIRVFLKYSPASEGVITGIERVSTPGRRMYAGTEEIPKVLNGFGIAIVSTSKGLMTDKAAREANVGGELLCKVW
ncbi:MAG: 30S ribosomal protein S8 [Deltaproteobacteria bacterium]|nr:30S ribosomal protein S8 [Deltaproteobacteria bacterium]